MSQQKIGSQIILLPCSAQVRSSLDQWDRREAVLFDKHDWASHVQDPVSKYDPSYLLLHFCKVTLPSLDHKTQLFNMFLVGLQFIAMSPLCLLKLLELRVRKERVGNLVLGMH